MDDIALTASSKWMDEMYKAFTKRFGKVMRQQLPFTHCGCEYEKVENDKEELETTLRIRDDALDGYKELLEEKTVEAQKSLDYSEQVCGQLSQVRSDKQHAKDQEERLREILEQTKDDKEKFLTERDELDEKHAFLQERCDKRHEDYEKSRAAVAASARQIASLQDRERRARADAEERERRMRMNERWWSSLSAAASAERG